MGSSARGSLFREGKQLLPGPLFQELLTWGKEITSLYKSSHAVSCILRALPVTSRHLVFRLVYYPASKAKPIPYETVRTLFRSEQTFTVARTRLLELRILNQTSVGNAVAFWLNEDFAQNLRQILSLDIEAPFAMDDTSVVEKAPTAKELKDHAHTKWESILHYLVGMDPNTDKSNTPPKSIVESLKRTNLLGDSTEGLKITNHGFQFLLKDPYTQVWVLLLDLVEAFTSGTIDDKAQIVLFLFQISFSVFMKGHQVSALTDTQFRMLEVLVELGLIFRRSKQSSWFYATEVGLQLVANTGSDGMAESKNVSANLGTCEIIAETNFRVYAYTTSRLQVDLISMFVHMRTRLPNLAVGHITNDSVRAALQNGITADQIIGYLNAHASTRCKDKRIPSNVSQMIRLWEAERDRVNAEEAVLFDNFETENGFEEVDRYSHEIGAKLWSDRGKHMLIVGAKSADAMKNFIRDNNIR